MECSSLLLGVESSFYLLLSSGLGWSLQKSFVCPVDERVFKGLQDTFLNYGYPFSSRKDIFERGPNGRLPPSKSRASLLSNPQKATWRPKSHDKHRSPEGQPQVNPCQSNSCNLGLIVGTILLHYHIYLLCVYMYVYIFIYLFIVCCICMCIYIYLLCVYMYVYIFFKYSISD